jgi:hypothetical protein
VLYWSLFFSFGTFGIRLMSLICNNTPVGPDNRRTDVGDIDGFDDLGRIAERLDLNCFHGCPLRRC